MGILEPYLTNYNIIGTTYEHPPVFTAEEATQVYGNIPGIPGKNLFLRDAKKKRYILVIVAGTKTVQLNELSEKLGEKKLSFASSDDLLTQLDITPGSVSPFCLIHETAKDVEVFIDTDLFNATEVNFHPLRNNAALVLSQDMFHKYLKTLKQKIHQITI